MTRHSTATQRALLVATLMASLGLAGCSDNAPTELSDEQRAEMVDRIKPVVTVAELTAKQDPAAAAAPVVAAAKSPEDLYNGACMACHAAGVAGAPLLGDAAAWGPRAAAGGIDALVKSAIAGKGAMPPRGGSAYSDDEIHQVVEFMLSKAGL